jgi:tetratricopeptide (TPR) repeat protein
MRILAPSLARAPTMARRARNEIAAQMAICAYYGSVPVDEAFAVLDRVSELRRGSLIDEAHDLRVRAGLLGMAGRFEEAHGLIARSRALYEELGAPRAIVTTSQIVAETLRLEGRLDDAERMLREMHEAYEEIGETGFNSTVCALLAGTLSDRGRFDEAARFVSKSRALAADDDFASQAGWRMAEARILAARADFDGALRLADEAVAITEGTDYLDMHAEAEEVRGLVLEAAGRGDDARATYEVSLGRYERKGNVVAAARVRGRLDAPGAR